MINLTDKQCCCGCHACYNCCPQKCISMQSDVEGFWYPVVDLERCTDCGLCEKACPVLCKSTVDNHPLAYACINKDDKIRKQSSSGGVFTVIAESVIANHGVVFGAGFDEEFSVVHSWTDSIDSLGNFRGSKYVQSCIGDTYKQIRDFLKQGRQVLFSGTPCQVAGLRTYLGKDYEALICLDIVCHGVPSPLVWEKYRSKMANNRAFKAISFRDKILGWRKYSISFEFREGEILTELGSENKYVQGFLKNLYLRPSCYNCSFKSINRQSDITLADFWGIENVLPNFDDDRGTSLILVNSGKGDVIFSSQADKVYCEKVNINLALLYNPSAIKSVDYNPKRSLFFKELGSTDISQLVERYTKVSFFRKVYVKGRTMLSRIKRQVIG
ncbi:Coenzyme F420 hydrogenase/dehydrogenase, beta subunit C-terminal domain [Desulfosporosinus sp. OT]|uniref:Coenzyme F420 hydrogenase/dehydrogenase, beta subunit C-terminal domain n=1 Tax=Desulfosporosinus sp. OT TaxID=913865 RepID=UPI000223A56E|nr:Coenzyme F420 hydrogenase/dehydrogenase, beta subunit C-terminal domain [Desulfosporosinus sp. OT]EGW41268.1 4Fe-4S binding domain protein [Desulfosporosinus sp. OT]